MADPKENSDTELNIADNNKTSAPVSPAVAALQRHMEKWYNNGEEEIENVA